MSAFQHSDGKRCIASEFNGEELRVWATWFGPNKPRTSCPPLTVGELGQVDEAARAWFGALPGTLVRTLASGVATYRRDFLPPDVVKV